MRCLFGAMALLAVASVACQKKSSSSSSSEPTAAVTPVVQSGEQPEAVTDPSAGVTPLPPASPAPSTAAPTSTPAPFYDLRKDATSALAAPAPDASLDPRTFTPTGVYAPGGGMLPYDARSHLLVADDGRSHVLPACQYPLPAPGHVSPAGLTIDGNLSDWPKGNVVGIDRSGDIAGPIDMTELYWASDATYYYIGVKVAGTYDNTGSAGQIYLKFSQLSVPADDTTMPAATWPYDYLLIVSGSGLFDDQGNLVPQGTGGGQINYQLATGSHGFELKLPRTAVDPALGSGPFTFATWSTDSTAYDYMGVHIVGLTDDYACLVPTPDTNGDLTSFKWLVMRRTAGVDAAKAELMYRAMIAAVPADQLVTQDRYHVYDTLPITSIKHMTAAGVYESDTGIFIAENILSPTGDYNTTPYHFHVAAHEYAHGLNATDYAFPTNWAREGHSDWVAYEASTSYFGASYFQQEFVNDMLSFLKEEADQGGAVKLLEDNDWGDAPFSSLYYYHKASFLYTMLAGKWHYADFLQTVAHHAPAYAAHDQDTMLNTILGLPGFSGVQLVDLKKGFLTSASTAPTFDYQALLSDADHDGLFAFQETALGTGPTQADSDGDFLGDGIESLYGFDPLVAQALPALAADNDLTDWTAKLPSALKTKQPQIGSCSAGTGISRYGAVYQDGWLYLAVELASVPADSTQKIVVWIHDDAHAYQLHIRAKDNSFALMNESPWTLARGGTTLVPFNGKVVEIGINAAWLGWDPAALPSGASVNIGSVKGASVCDSTQASAPLAAQLH